MNNITAIFVEKKTIIIEVAILILFLGGGYYAYTYFTDSSATTVAAPNQALLGPNFVTFINAVEKDKISFQDVDALKSSFVDRLEDKSETINPTSARGRPEPFIPYATSRPIR